MKKINEINGKKYKAIDERNHHASDRMNPNKFSINSQGYSAMKKPIYGLSEALKDLKKAVRTQRDSKVNYEINYIFDTAKELMDILKNKKYKT